MSVTSQSASRLRCLLDRPVDERDVLAVRAFGEAVDQGSVVFSPDGHTLATASSDNTARLWETDVDRVVARICDITPTITRSEWDQYLAGLTYQPPCSRAT